MIHVRIIEAREFMNDDNFIKFDELKKLLFKIKQNELALKMKLGDFDEVDSKFVQKLHEYDPTSKTLTME